MFAILLGPQVERPKVTPMMQNAIRKGKRATMKKGRKAKNGGKAKKGKAKTGKDKKVLRDKFHRFLPAVSSMG